MKNVLSVNVSFSTFCGIIQKRSITKTSEVTNKETVMDNIFTISIVSFAAAVVVCAAVEADCAGEEGTMASGGVY